LLILREFRENTSQTIWLYHIGTKGRDQTYTGLSLKRKHDMILWIDSDH
jgi:hypothetical protein